VLYECLAGPDRLRTAVLRWREAGSRGAFPGLDALVPTRTNPAVVEFLSEALSPDERRRPATAERFAEALRRLARSGHD
jgi:hypothetical protein